MGAAVLAFIIEKSYVHIIFTIFSQQILDELLQVFYLNPPSRLFSCPPIIASNKLSLKICCKNIVNITFIFIISYPCSHIHVPIQILITMAFAFNLIQKVKKWKKIENVSCESEDLLDLTEEIKLLLSVVDDYLVFTTNTFSSVKYMYIIGNI